MDIFKQIVIFLVLMLGVFTGRAEEYNENFIKGEEATANQNYTEALSFYKKGALEGDSQCYSKLGIFYLTGIGTDVNLQEARKWGNKAYLLGDAWGAYTVGLSYLLEYGMENPEALKMAVPYLEFGYNADNRNPNNEAWPGAGCMIASYKISSGEYDKGLEWLERVVKDYPWHTPSIGFLSYCYMGVEDYKNAVKYATIADKDDNFYGTFVLGWCLLYGKGILQNTESGFKKIRKVANIGMDSASMFTLAECYYNGIGTPSDKELAKEWYQKSADAGYEEAIEKLKILF